MSIHQNIGDDITISILGGGQLGAMLIEEAAHRNIRTRVLDPALDAPCSGLATAFVQGDLGDGATVVAFGKQASVQTSIQASILTIEIESVNAAALAELSAQHGTRVYPLPEHIALLQDKGRQKDWLVAHGFPTAPFTTYTPDNEGSDDNNVAFPAIMKLHQGGYDGQGVALVSDAGAARTQWATWGERPCLVEQKVAISTEIAIVVARSHDGEVVCYDPVEMCFRHHVLDYLITPADSSPALSARITQMAQDIVKQMGYIGVLAIEFFVDETGGLFINEFAPRVHNSGHHTRLQTVTSQYGQLLRVLLHEPLGDTTPVRPYAGVVNILGSTRDSDGDSDGGSDGAGKSTGTPLYLGLAEVLEREGVFVYLYRKQQTRLHRKMGHVTVLGDTREAVIETIRYVQERLKVVPE